MADYAQSMQIVPSIVRSVAFGGISGTYAGIGTVLTEPARIFLLQNFTDTALMISHDGLNDNYPINAQSSILLDVTSNRIGQMGGFIAAGTRIYVKTLGVPSSGSIYLTTFYGVNGA